MRLKDHEWLIVSISGFHFPICWEGVSCSKAGDGLSGSDRRWSGRSLRLRGAENVLEDYQHSSRSYQGMEVSLTMASVSNTTIPITTAAETRRSQAPTAHLLLQKAQETPVAAWRGSRSREMVRFVEQSDFFTRVCLSNN